MSNPLDLVRRWTVRLLAIAAVLATALSVFVFAARSGWLTPDEATLRARYALPDSRYLEVDSQVVHYVDQGQGPAIILLHGSFGSLHNWNHWAEILAQRYRVIRFDRPRMGLSGPASTGRTDLEQELRTIDALQEALGIDTFFLVATSSAGVAGAAYAAEHPEHVDGLVLANVAVGPFSPSQGERPAVFRFLLRIDPWFKGWRPREFWRQVLRANFHQPGKVSAELAREWADLNNRAQRMPPAPQVSNPMAIFERTVSDLERMSVPTLLLWSDHDHELPVETVGYRGLALLGSSDKDIQIIANCGHMMPLECGEESALQALDFFDRVGFL